VGASIHGGIPLAYERVMGMQIDDAEGYRKYREAMEPLMIQHGGRIRYDFWIGEVLHNETDKKINRVFVITFDSKQKSDEFFAAPEYKEIRTTFFNPAVSDVTTIAEFEGR
jgi:uncharacterized protein (DUF1330 family)